MAANQKMQLIKRERRLFQSSDDNAMMKQVMATHTPDGREIDVRPILEIVEDILHRATPTVVLASQAYDGMEERIHHGEVLSMLETLAFTIHRIACELSCKCSGGGDAHASTMAVFNMLGSYSWDAKVVLPLAAFAVSHGEFWLTAQLFAVNPLAKSVALLKQIPVILEHTDILKPRFDALNTLVKATLGVTKRIIELKELPTEYISADTPAMTMAVSHIPAAVYWTIRSVVACSSQIISLIGMGSEYMTSTTEAWELSSLAHKVSNIEGHLTKQLDLCLQHIDEKKHLEAYQNLVRLFEMVHIDNIKIIRALIPSKDDLPLVDGITKERVSVDVLRKKIVVLLISDLNIKNEELGVLTRIYNETPRSKYERNYEVVWLPVIDKSTPWTDAQQNSFVQLASMMPWYSLCHPSLLEPAVIKYIKEVWHFQRKLLLVVLDAQGRMVCPNALHMIWIWGSVAFPFTSLREGTLWKEETAWRIEFLVDEIDANLLQWVREGKYICLYGGEDLEWIKQFTLEMRRVAQETRISMEMLYVGKSNPKERVRKINTTITEQNLSSCWHNLDLTWYFWSRLESMLYSKMQQGHTTENDAIMQEVTTMLAFDGSGGGWALISKGSTEMIKADGKKIVECLLHSNDWKENVEQYGFIPALSNALEPYRTHEHCTRLILPSTGGEIPENVVCAECKRSMEKYLLYRCCND